MRPKKKEMLTTQANINPIQSCVFITRENQQVNMTSHPSSELGRRNSTTLSIATLRPIGTAADSRKHTIADVCTFVRFVHGGLLKRKFVSSRKILEKRKEKVHLFV